MSSSSAFKKDEEYGTSPEEINLGHDKKQHVGEKIMRESDPFTVRKGKHLTWKNVNMKVQKRAIIGKENSVRVLKDVWGEVHRKQITAIMGPSGAGKTSLLNVLAGRVSLTKRGNTIISADIRLNNSKVNPSKMDVRKQIAFVAQEDSLLITSTPREALCFSAKMRLPRSMTRKELDSLVHRMLEELGLLGCADTIVGDHLIKGISGGEKKRTSVGVELVVKPALVFLDEPTSGLDSFSAIQLIQVLKKIANVGASVLFTIHQPASEVFNSFDNLILLNNGQVMMTGPIHNVLDNFALRGYQIPRHFNPADWIMNVAQSVSEKQLKEEGFFSLGDHPSITLCESDGGEGQDALGPNDHVVVHQHISLGTQIYILIKRDITHTFRNRKALIARFALTISINILIGVIFLGSGSRSSTEFLNLQSHFGAITLVLVQAMFGTAMPSLLSFPEERPVFLREYSTNHYSVLAYFVSRLFIEAVLTFLQMFVSMNFFLLLGIVYILGMASTAVTVLMGCSVEDPKMAQEFLPLLFVPQFLFAGFFTPTNFIPSWLRWAQYLCSLTYAMRIALLAEFMDCAEEVQNCAVLLKKSNVYVLPEWGYWVILCALFLCFRCVALVILQKKATKFL